MAESDRIQFMHGYPIPTRDHATLLASHRLLLEAARECLPVRVTPRGETTFFEDWEITRAAFIARMSGTLRHLSYLAPSYSRLDGFALARTLVDHVITFAWVSADPKERQPAFLRDSFSNLLRKDARFRSRGDGPLLGDSQRKGLTAFVERVKQTMPGLRERAGKADAHWVEQVRSSLPEPLHIIICSASTATSTTSTRLTTTPPQPGSRSSSTWPETQSSRPSMVSRSATWTGTCAPTGSLCSPSRRR
jgi:hypothetical protein